ncbi:MAG: single-stranded-DNA-specific exonuclease RecJ [Chloroflexia bacterium]|nr:single-stranded-DNA-specific exonuclease RecJ [Chloroflexia bacterium]
MQPATPVWSVHPPAPPKDLAPFADWPPLLGQILWNRGLRGAEAAADFLQPDYRRLADPFLMKGMAEACERIAHAIRQGEPITIYGDFDADGVTAAALLVQAMRQMGGQVSAYLPHRLEEGYGLHREAVERLAAQGTALLITVDCGISNADEVARAAEVGLDVIVTDHHLPPEQLPPALAILNPRQEGCAYPYKRLAGVGIAFMLVRGLAKAGLPLNGLRGRELLDLVALGTVADVSPLGGENRILVAHGLESMRQTRRPGLRALLAVAGLRPETVNTGTIGFSLGPRLNAAGRLQDAITAYRLLLAETQEEAAVLAEELDALNRARQELTAEILERARQQVLALPESRKLILLADPHFPAGVVGLVAGKLVEEFFRPTLLIERGESQSRGSARSVPDFHVTAALTHCAHLLTRYGGHRLAAGFGVANENLVDLEACLLAQAEQQLDERSLTPTLWADVEARLEQLDGELYQLLEQMAPFGVENPRPVFMCRALKVVESRRVGQEGRHLKLKLGQGRLVYDAIAFRYGQRAGECPTGSCVDVLATLDMNEWGGRKSLQLKLRDFHPAQQA